MADSQGRLDQMIEIAAKVSAAIGVIAPGVPILQVGTSLVKFLVEQVNRVRTPDSPEIPLPTDAELIDRLEATSTRIVDTGTEFLNQKPPDQP